ncbi:MAG TPA: rhodanese-like domain-containing protein [Chthoniobacterales bacterium]|nr:rhodanese-like domain-containing protein [Chthoniobacterales bacterium]
MKPALIGLGLIAVLALAWSGRSVGWALVNAKIRNDFPEVPRITTTQLADWLQNTARPAPLLLDVRRRTEYAVSHLADAQHVEPDAPASIVHEPKERPIVTYCSVGYRSSSFAQKLRAAGYANVRNLEGSIFRWANEGRPVFRGDERVEQVHPYDRTWGFLLKKKYRAEL